MFRNRERGIDDRYEPGLLNIFRLYSGGIAIVVLLIALRIVRTQDMELNGADSFVYMCIIHVLLFVYLSIPVLRRWLKQFYLPLAILVSVLAPLVLTNLEVREGAAVRLLNNFDVTVVLLFPMVITAWQYTFDIVFLFFVVVGMINPLILFLIHEPSAVVVDSVYSSLIRAVVLSALGFVITELMTRQRQQRKELETANRRMKEFTATLEHLVESRERNRLARDLHDTLAHTLSGLAVQLEAITAVVPEDQKTVREMLDTALTTTREGLSETRAALKNLRATPLDNLGLKLAIQGLLENAAERGGFEFEFTPEDVPEDLGSQHEQMVYRVVQEALENVVRHAEAGRVKAVIGKTPGFLVFRIEDDGKGFVLTHDIADEHFGIRGMRERAEMSGAELTINSAEGRGTSVALALKEVEKRRD